MGQHLMSGEPLASQYLEYRNFTEYPIFDADQHLTEGPDAFTRHIDKRYAERTLQVAERDGKSVLLVDGVARARDAHADEAPHPGSLKEMLKGIKQGSSEAGSYQYMKPDPAFSNAELRIKQLDKQNIEA